MIDFTTDTKKQMTWVPVRNVNRHHRLVGAEILGLESLLDVKHLGHICSQNQCYNAASVHSFRAERRGEEEVGGRG